MATVRKAERKVTSYAARPWLKLVPRPVAAYGNDVELYMPSGDAVILDVQLTETSVRMTLDEAATLTITVSDPLGDLSLLTLKSANESRLLDGVDLRWRGVWWRIARLERQDNAWRITAEDRVAAYLRSKKREMSASRADVTRAQFVQRLAKGVRAGGGIPVYIPELMQKQGIYKPDVPTAKKTKARATASSGSSGSVWDTSNAESAGWGSAASKVKVKRVRATATQLSVANKILVEAARLGCSRRVMIAGIMCATTESMMGANQSSRVGTPGIIQQDSGWNTPAATRDPTLAIRSFYTRPGRGWKATHGSLKAASGNLGRRIAMVQDNADQSGGNYAEWESESTKTVDLWLDRNQGAAGAGASSEDEATETQYRGVYKFRTGTDGSPQNWWDATGALADEVQWHRWAVSNTLGFATDSEMIRGNPVLWLSRERVEIQDFTWSWDYRREASELSVEIALDDPFQLLPGMVAMVDDEAPVSGRWLVDSIEVDPLKSNIAAVSLRRRGAKKLEPAPEIKTKSVPTSAATAVGGKESYGGAVGSLTTDGGAKGIVDQAFRAALAAGGTGVYVGSDIRPGSTTSSGNPSDHGSNDAGRAARDIGVKGIDLLVGPPSPKLDAGVVAIGRLFGKNYGNGRRTIIDTFQWKGFRVQIIWRTPKYGGHMGHIHIGVRKGG